MKVRLLVAVLVAVVLLAVLVAACNQGGDVGAQSVNLTRVRALLVTNDAQFNGDVRVGGNVQIDGSAQVGGRYPIGNAANGQIIEFGATGAFTETVVTPVAISTVTAVGCNVNSPSAAAQVCYAVRSGRVITLTIVNSAVTPVAITTPHAAGASFWIGGD